MIDDRSAESYRAPFLRAMHEDASHFSAALRSDDGAYTDLPEALLRQLGAAAGRHLDRVQWRALDPLRADGRDPPA